MNRTALLQPISGLPSLPPSETCFSCRGCCVFNDPHSHWIPYFREEEKGRAIAAGIPESAFSKAGGSKIIPVQLPLASPHGPLVRCPALDPVTHACTIYPVRPLDCQLYPFILMWDHEKIVLALHEACPFVLSQGTASPDLRARANQLAAYLESPETVERLAGDFGLIMAPQPDTVPLVLLDRLTDALLKRSAKSRLLDSLKPFQPEDYPLFERYRALQSCELAHAALQPHLIWSDLLEYRWAILADAFCLFATAAGVTHLACPPLGSGPIEQASALAFELLADLNPRSILPRMDNADEQTATQLAQAGYRITPAPPDYLYLREAIARLAGNRFRSQRAAVNQATRHNPVLRPFAPEDQPACEAVFNRWAKADKPALSHDEAMMRDDARAAHQAVMRRHAELNLTGRVVSVDNTIAGYTFGFWLAPDQFCILVEIADRTIRGLSTWLFHKFCNEMQRAVWINAMDDSGLPGLAHAKSLWHPGKKVPAYTVTSPF